MSVFPPLTIEIDRDIVYRTYLPIAVKYPPTVGVRVASALAEAYRR